MLEWLKKPEKKPLVDVIKKRIPKTMEEKEFAAIAQMTRATEKTYCERVLGRKDKVVRLASCWDTYKDLLEFLKIALYFDEIYDRIEITSRDMTMIKKGLECIPQFLEACFIQVEAEKKALIQDLLDKQSEKT